ncbi:MAG: acyl-CoA thioesterase [Bacteroidetes bacterium]|jgi:acyl-CoA hydrolase|nr:acyl-CoA thioesterase [Bacteroidota bacterium]
MKSKTPQDSYTEITEMVLPNDTNPLGNLMGGRLLHLMDIAAAIAAGRHSNRVCVTASVDFVDFKSPIKLGEVVIITARVTCAFTTSMEIKLQVWAENTLHGTRRECNHAYYTFVAVDQGGQPIPVNELKPTTAEELELQAGAKRRRELRLILAGKRTPEEVAPFKELLQQRIDEQQTKKP